MAAGDNPGPDPIRHGVADQPWPLGQDHHGQEELELGVIWRHVEVAVVVDQREPMTNSKFPGWQRPRHGGICLAMDRFHGYSSGTCTGPVGVGCAGVGPAGPILSRRGMI